MGPGPASVSGEQASSRPGFEGTEERGLLSGRSCCESAIANLWGLVQNVSKMSVAWKPLISKRPLPFMRSLDAHAFGFTCEAQSKAFEQIVIAY